MSTLITFVSFLLFVAAGAIALIFIGLFLAVLAVVAVKAFRMLIALFNASIAEPEAKLVREAQRVNITAAKKARKKKKK